MTSLVGEAEISTEQVDAIKEAVRVGDVVQLDDVLVPILRAITGGTSVRPTRT